ncbi:cytochrome P450 [Verrucomicrobia bacterium LW23]|nr:cytochrome P450 [Verrucomicrobia bacterium LW23]
MTPPLVPRTMPGWNIAHLCRFLQNPMTFVRDVERECGPVAFFTCGVRRFLLIAEPELIAQVLVKQSRQFEKSLAIKSTRRFLGNGLLTAEGADHVRNRRLMQPAFHMQRVAAYGDSMVQYAEEAQAQWKDGQEIDIAEEMMKLTLRVVGKTLFNSDTGEVGERVSQAMSVLMNLFPLFQLPFFPWLEHLPLPFVRRMRAADATLNEVVLGIIAERHKDNRDEGDLLSMLLNSQEEDGTGLTDEQVRDEVLTLFLAGHETTGNALAYTWHLLAKHPEAAAKMRDEISTVLGDAAPTIADTRRLPYTESVITESMRLYPPAWIIARGAMEDLELANMPGVPIPRGTTIMMPQALVHLQERYYDDPLVFRPERWTPEFRDSLPRFAYYPFGGGPRSCIGESFAWMELILVTAVIARKWKMEPVVPEHKLVLHPSVTLRPRTGVRVKLRRIVQ